MADSGHLSRSQLPAVNRGASTTTSELNRVALAVNVPQRLLCEAVQISAGAVKAAGRKGGECTYQT